MGDPAVLLNKRSEIMERCRHRDSLVLTNNVRSRSYIGRNTDSVEKTVPSTSAASTSGVLPAPDSLVVTSIPSSSLNDSKEDPAYPSSSLPPVNGEVTLMRNMRSLDRDNY